MKIFNWIWSKKQEQVEVYEVPQWESYTAKAERFNADHGLPLDQLVGVTHETTKEIAKQKETQATRAVL